MSRKFQHNTSGIDYCFLIQILLSYILSRTLDSLFWSKRPIRVEETRQTLPFAFRYYSYTAHGAVIGGQERTYERNYT